MKKLVFFLFFVCISAPSFANQCADRPVVTRDGSQLLYYDAGINAVQNYIECNDSKNNNFMVGCDGKIYKCDGKKWQLVPSNKMKTCPQGWKAASQRIKPANTILNPTDAGDIYFFTPINKIYVLEDSICQYTKSQCDKDQNDCKKSGRMPINCSICAPFTITCDNTQGNGCQIDGNDWEQYVVNNCNDIGTTKQLKKDSPIIIDTSKTGTLCDDAIKKANKTGNCRENQGRYVGSYYVVVCDNDEFIKTKGTKYDGINDADLSYAEKKCQGSGGRLSSDKKTCTNCPDGSVDSTGECICTSGSSKYPVDGFCHNNTACLSTGGNPKDENGNECDCDKDKHLKPTKTSNNFAICECEENYHYRDPMRRWEGCVEINGTVTINGTVINDNGETIPYATVKVSNSSNGTTTNDAGQFLLQNVPNTEYVTFSSVGYKTTTWAATDLQEATVRMYTNTKTLNAASPLTPEQSKQMTMPGTPADACEYSGGVYRTNQCFCDSNNHLEPYEPENAKDYTICTCMRGYKRKNAEMDTNGNTTWYPEKDPCIPANDYEIQIKRDDMAMQRDAEDAYRNEYNNAQSWANKGTTALSTLMTGEGAMMAARAIAEKIADDDAEREMAEYVSKMKCEYGGGQSVNLGDTETLPGGNELANYYAEYKQLADKLKATKAALNLRPGIEAEVLYDRAETGLYQYQTAERQSGGFTSLSRALMNPEGADAEQWNAQRTETNRDLWVGGALATVGLAGSYIANRAINKNHVKKYKELEEKFREIKIQLEHEYPEIFTAPTPQQPIHEESVGTLDPVIPSIETLPANELNAIDLSNLTDKAFNRSEIDLTNEGTEALTTEAKYLDDQLNEHPNMNITITATGHADPDGISAKTATALTNRYKEIFNVDSLPDKYKNKKIGKNDDLALARAEVALKFLTEKLSEDTKKRVSTIAQTRGDRDCPKGTPKEKYATCRYVGFEVQINITGAQ